MTDDLRSIAEALAYVTEVYRELAQENGSPTLGTQNQMVEFVLNNGALREAARRFAMQSGQGEAMLEPHQRPPLDAAFCRVRDRMRETMERPNKFR